MVDPSGFFLPQFNFQSQIDQFQQVAPLLWPERLEPPVVELAESVVLLDDVVTSGATLRAAALGVGSPSSSRSSPLASWPHVVSHCSSR